MDLNIIVRRLIDEMAAQWVADSAKKTNITDVLRYNMIVAQVNANHQAGAFPAELDSESAWSIAGGWVADLGYPGVYQIFNDQEADWATYPIAQYVPV